MASAGYFASRWKGVAPNRCHSRVVARRRKIVGRRHCLTGTTVGPIALSKAGSRFSAGGSRIHAAHRHRAPRASPHGSCRLCQIADAVIAHELVRNRGPEGGKSEMAEIVVEVLHHR